MAAYASLISLMQVLHDLEHHPSPPISLEKQIVDSITQRITYFQEFLHSYISTSPVADDDEEVADPLEMRIAGAAFAAEDAIEYHIVDCIKKKKKKKKANDHKKAKSLNRCYGILQSVIEEMDSIKNLVVDTQKIKKVPMVHDQVGTTNITASVADRNETFVGSDGILIEIMEKLIEGKTFQVISIVGMGGIGKTFLAKTIYIKPRIKDRFDICAWATISQNYDTGEILRELLSQATKTNKEQMSGKSVDQLGLDLYKYLFPRRFLIVMDDMWSIDSWNNIKHYLKPCFLYMGVYKEDQRIRVSTLVRQWVSEGFLKPTEGEALEITGRGFLQDLVGRNLILVDKLGSTGSIKYCKIHDLVRDMCLKEGQKEGFYHVMGKCNRPSPQRRVIIPDYNCKGLPLSISVVGGLLKNMDGTRTSWESIRDNFTSVVNMRDDKHCLRLLKLSYNHLPVYLKPCFLYMGVFEEDERICVSTLVRQWVSEGFLKPTEGEALEITGRGFLQDLVDRNLILIDKLGSTGNIRFCKVHDLVRDMCLKEGQKEGFYHVMGKSYHPSPQRRVIIPDNTLKEYNVRGDLRLMSHTRSIICKYGKVPLCKNQVILRTWNYYEMDLNSVVSRYVNLRNLAISGLRMRPFLPSISHLWNLRTLVVSYSSAAVEPILVVDFWEMTQLRHMNFPRNYACLPDPPSCDGRDVVAVVIMENLHTLKGIRNFKFRNGVVKRIPNIKKLNLVYKSDDTDDVDLNDEDNDDVYFLGNMKYLCGLESLFIRVLPRSRRFTPLQKITYPHSLKKLTLDVYTLEWDDMLEKIGSLPLLEKLELVFGFFGKGKWEIGQGQFPCLKYLKMFLCLGLENWSAVEENSSILPRLEHLHLHTLRKLKKIPFELGNIDTLKSIKLEWCGEGAVKSAKEMFDEQVELQGGEDQLSFHVKVTLGWEQQHLTSLAASNFYVI